MIDKLVKHLLKYCIDNNINAYCDGTSILVNSQAYLLYQNAHGEYVYWNNYKWVEFTLQDPNIVKTLKRILLNAN